MHYVDEGEGSPVVMVHGNPTWSFYYRNLIKELRGDHRVIVPDHIGCGKSDMPVDGTYHFTLEQRVRDLESLLDSLGIHEDITLIVHDWGGMIGFAYATRHPERISRIVVLNTAAFGLPKTKRFPWQLWLVRNTPLGPFLVRGLNLFVRGTVRYGAMKPLSPEIRDQYLAPCDSWEHRLAVLRFVEDIPLAPGDPSYETVQQVESRLPLLSDIPMLICWGDQDFIFDAHFLAEWQKRFPKATLHRFANAGHLVLEDAVEEIPGLVRSFMAPVAAKIHD
jgi:haloalkane dehalogenase